jgi:hypothetical protein
MTSAVILGAALGMLVNSLFVGWVAVTQRGLTPDLEAVRRRFFPGATLTALMLGITGASLLFWPLVGALYGLAYGLWRLAGPHFGLGSPHWPFSLLVTASAAGLFGRFLLRAETRLTTAVWVGLYSVIFGWLLPWFVE